jgi:hypothetical protein
MILPNVRGGFGRAEATLVIHLLAQGDERIRSREESRLQEEGFDALLDDPRTFNALIAARGVTFASEELVFYLLVRHALLEGGIGSRAVADYLAALLQSFGRGDRAYRIDDDGAERHEYLVDILEEMSTAQGREAFLLRAHLGEFSLWLSGLFADYIAARVQRRGAPGLEYYQELGATGYRLAADTVDAKRCGMDAIYGSCAEIFPELRMALNRVADRHLFPTAGDGVERLLRQVRDAAGRDPSGN